MVLTHICHALQPLHHGKNCPLDNRGCLQTILKVLMLMVVNIANSVMESQPQRKGMKYDLKMLGLIDMCAHVHKNLHTHTDGLSRKSQEIRALEHGWI